MYISNISFFVLPSRETEFIQWIRNEIAIHVAAGKGEEHSLSRLAESGNGEDEGDEARSVAYQVKFPTFEAAAGWRDNELMELAERFIQKFGPDAMFFTSIFETIPV